MYTSSPCHALVIRSRRVRSRIGKPKADDDDDDDHDDVVPLSLKTHLLRNATILSSAVLANGNQTGTRRWGNPNIP